MCVYYVNVWCELLLYEYRKWKTDNEIIFFFICIIISLFHSSNLFCVISFVSSLVCSLALVFIVFYLDTFFFIVVHNLIECDLIHFVVLSFVSFWRCSVLCKNYKVKITLAVSKLQPCCVRVSKWTDTRNFKELNIKKNFIKFKINHFILIICFSLAFPVPVFDCFQHMFVHLVYGFSCSPCLTSSSDLLKECSLVYILFIFLSTLSPLLSFILSCFLPC